MSPFRGSTGRLAAFVLVLSCAVNASAYRREYVATVGDVRKPESQVCFYGGKNASDAFTLYFSYDQTGCLPADLVLEMPPGLFHVFARHPDGYVSGFDDFFVNKRLMRSEEAYDRLDIPMAPAARVGVAAVVRTLAPGQRIGVWLAPTETESATYFPLIDGESEIYVPGDRPFVPILSADGAPVALGEPMTLKAGQTASMPPFRIRPGVTDIIGWIKVDKSDPGLIRREGLQPPELAVVSGGETYRPLFPIFETTGASLSLQFFKNVPVGDAQLVVRGKTWVHSETEIVAAAAPATAVRAPILIAPAGALSVAWNLESESQSLPACAGDAGKRPKIEVQLLRCSGADGINCSPIATEAAEFRAQGSIQFEGLPPGDYSIVTRPPFSRQVTTRRTIVAGDDVIVDAALPRFRFFGKVRVNGKDTHARLVFSTGEVQTAADGTYTAVVAGDPLTNLIEVVSCSDQSVFKFIPEKRVVENTVYDIDIRDRAVRVKVIGNAATPLANAAVQFSPVRSVKGDEVGIHFTSQPVESDESGVAVLGHAPAEHSLVICAKHPDYLRTCTSPISPQELSSDRPLVVTMSSASVRGRVIGHAGSGSIALVNKAGAIVEEALLTADGKFELRREHAPTEHIVYVSDMRPLTAFAPIDTPPPGAELVLQLPTLAGRAVNVNIADMASEGGFVGIWMNGYYVPLDLLAYHHDARGIDVAVKRGRSLRLVDLAAEEIAVAFAPEVAMPGPFVDPFLRPENAGIRRYRVSGASVTVPAH